VFSVVSAAALSEQWLGKNVTAAMNTNTAIEERYFLYGPCRDVIRKGLNLIEMSFNTGSRSAWEAVKIEPERVKLKNLHC
jgi:hypothetical protein